jgi:hypothetical protein
VDRPDCHGTSQFVPPLEDALQLVHLTFERESLKAEPGGARWLLRYLSEGTPCDVAEVTASLADLRRQHEDPSK